MLKGTAKLKFDDGSLYTMHTAWNIDRGVPINHFYGADGPIDSSVGTQENVSGACQFVVPQTGPEINFYALQGRPFTASWELGPSQRYSAKNCFLSSVGQAVNNAQGQLIINCQLSALTLRGPY